MLAFFSRNIEFDKPQVTIENPIFQSTKYREKELCLDNKVQETFGDVFCPKCRNEKCAFFSTNETTNFYDCKKGKTCCHVLNNSFKDQKPTIILLGDDGTPCFVRKTSRDYEKGKPSPLLKKFLRQSVPSKTEIEPKKAKLSPNMEWTFAFLIGWWFDDLSNIFIFQIISFSFNLLPAIQT